MTTNIHKELYTCKDNIHKNLKNSKRQIEILKWLRSLYNLPHINWNIQFVLTLGPNIYLRLKNHKEPDLIVVDMIREITAQLNLHYKTSFVIKYEESPITFRSHFHVISNKYLPKKLIEKKWKYGFVKITRIVDSFEEYFCKPVEYYYSDIHVGFWDHTISKGYLDIGIKEPKNYKQTKLI